MPVISNWLLFCTIQGVMPRKKSMNILSMNAIFFQNLSNSFSVESVEGDPTDMGVCGS